MTYSRDNHLESLDIDQEHDQPDTGLVDPEIDEELGRLKLVFCSDDRDRVLEDCSYVWVDPDYCGVLSPGQQRCYEILIAIQTGTLYSITTVSRLAEAQGLKTIGACLARLDNLQSLGAISGFNP